MRQHLKNSKSIVLLGTFNPVIFQPFWFVEQQLIGKQDGEDAEVSIIHQDVVNFKLSWCNIEITRERFVIATIQEHAFELIRDLVISTFRKLSHTPIKNIGINTELHFDLKTEQKWHEFGHKLAPKDPFWSHTMKNPGLTALSIEGLRQDNYLGNINVEVRPSKVTQYGLTVRVNDHYVVKRKDVLDATGILSILENDWFLAQDRAMKIIDGLLKTAAG